MSGFLQRLFGKEGQAGQGSDEIKEIMLSSYGELLSKVKKMKPGDKARFLFDANNPSIDSETTSIFVMTLTLQTGKILTGDTGFDRKKGAYFLYVQILE